jgi:hypothetical protein
MKLKEVYISPLKSKIFYKIGENALDNDNVIEGSNPFDIWFHVSGLKSCHVVAAIPLGLRLDKKIVRHIVNQGAVICKENSYPSSKKLEIIYTHIKHIKLTVIPGKVIVPDEYRKTKVI